MWALWACVAGENPASESVTTTEAVLDYRTDPGEPPANGFQLKMPAAEVAPYTDQTLCYYGTYNGPSMGVPYYEWFQDIHYGHHFMMLAADPSDNHADGDIIPCADPDGSGMAAQRPLFQGTEAKSVLNGKMVLPEGKAVHLHQGQRWIMQSHYVNSSAHTLLVQDSVNVWTVPEAEVTDWVSAFVFNNSLFTLPLGTSTLQVDCTWTRPVTVITLMGHLHDWGTRFSVDHKKMDGSTKRIYEIPDWDPDWTYEPQVKFFADGSLTTRTGDVFSTQCSWDNQSGEELEFPKEMCVAIGMAYPLDMPILCDTGAGVNE